MSSQRHGLDNLQPNGAWDAPIQQGFRGTSHRLAGLGGWDFSRDV